MNLSEVCGEVRDRLDTIDGLNAFGAPPGSLTPPAAVVLNPDPGDMVYDATYGRGMDRLTLPVVVVVGGLRDPSANEAVRAYLDGTGPRSVKAVLESGEYLSLHTIRVSVGGVDGLKWGGTDYIVAVFELDITGQGSA